MSDQWYYHRNGVALGPVSQAQLSAIAQSGEIGPADLVWREGLAEWMPVSALGLFEPTAPPLPPPLPSTLPLPPKSTASLPPREQPSAIVWPVVIGGGIVALVAAAAIGWLAHALTRPSESPRQSVATAPAPPASASDRPVRAAAQPVPVAIPASPPVEENPQVVPPVSVTPPPAAETPPVTQPMPPTSPTPGTVAEPSPPQSQPTQPQPDQPPLQVETLYQELDIRRSPKFSILGSVTVQDLEYQMLSELRVGPPDAAGSRAIEQYVLDTKLLKADDLSQAMFEQSLAALRGWWFKYTISKGGEIVAWKGGPPDGRRAARIEPPGGVGFLMTSVMDEDGWKEMAKLSFQAPDDATSGNQPWVRQMSHDFGALGSWYGETRFQRQGSADGLLRVDYTHDMLYTPPAKGKAVGELPFTITAADFTAEVAGGSFYFDLQAKRVERVQERFLMKGQIETEVLGQAVAVEVEEDQLITLRILGENPWKE